MLHINKSCSNSCFRKSPPLIYDKELTQSEGEDGYGSYIVYGPKVIDGYFNY